MSKLYTIIEVVNEKSSIDIIKQLFQEYAQSLNFSLSFQNFQKELDELPGAYSPPKGLLLLALAENKPAGCVALKPLEDKFCEMKRLYVRPEFRGLGIGKGLAIHLISRAKALAYHKMRLDTISTMKEALTLYQSLGFYEILPYYNNPVQGAHYLELKLS